MKVVLGLGNPGPRYDDTRHNVGWWVVDRLAHDWRTGPFRKEGAALTAEGSCAGHPVRLLKPLTYMNRSGAALAAPELRQLDPSRDLLVVVDDATLDVGRVRFRPGGSAGGHNGLKSVEAVLKSNDYARLRVGVGVCPPGADLADWVLSPMPGPDEQIVTDLLPELARAVQLWVEEGTESARARFNR
ncbi:MAG: aminoacyl-tRNA hydrolase [Gemmatimonadetes bacterium]|nr:aminoacyl-tRNA hydrolase [Gemmatimonadota bacterium]